MQNHHPFFLPCLIDLQKYLTHLKLEVIMKINSHFAEVIESSYTGFLAQSWQWDSVPRFGSLVTITQEAETLIAIVYQANTGSMEPGRYPFAYQKTEQELRDEQPQIFEFLKTTFSCLTLGYIQNDQLYCMTAPQPPKIHSLVQRADTKIKHKVLIKPDYLSVLFGAANLVGNLDELLLALLAQQAELDLLQTSAIHEFMRSYALLANNEYRRIKLFLQRIQQLSLQK